MTNFGTVANKNAHQPGGTKDAVTEKAVGPPFEPLNWREVVLDGIRALDHDGLALCRSHDFRAVAVDHKSVLAARMAPERLVFRS